jgi:hypothetical protein
MSKRALLSFAAVFGAGVIALVAVAAVERKSEAFTLGVVPGGGIARLPPQGELCQRPIDVVESFRKVWLQVGTYERSGQPFLLEVREARSDRSIVQARNDGAYRDNQALIVQLPREVPEGVQLAVCVRNLGDRAIAPYGNSPLSNRTNAAYRDGHRIEGDLAFVFLHAEPASVLGLVPSIVERASLFHGGWASTAVYWVLLLVLLVGPASLAALAIRAALRDST